VLVAGVDEAGRGALLGPLVVAGICLRQEALAELSLAGVRDSKRLRPGARARLFELLRRSCERIEVEVAEPALIDQYVAGPRGPRRLNDLEASLMAKLIGRLGAEVVYVDCPDVKPRRFGSRLRALLEAPPRLIVRHHADRDFLPVAAASIVAKVLRDREVAALGEAHGELGSGYPSDPRTARFLRGWLARQRAPPAFARLSWRSWARLAPPRDEE
jgi:ribonuclease HII